ncbi:MAG TPA: hypothetical protein VF710_21780 [Longimicrobium sp.]|jgi:hypothetical protein
MLYTDFILFGPVAAVQATSQRGTSAQWAGEFRRNLLMGGEIPPLGYFLIVTPDSIYLWKDSDVEPVVRLPDAVIPAAPHLTRYLDCTRVCLDTVDPSIFKMIVDFWLSDFGYPVSKAADIALANGFEGTGFIEAVRGGRMARDEAV